MAVSIRLQRIGKPHQSYYRMVAIEKTRGPHGKPLEVLGSYDPRGEKIKNKLTVKSERVQWWIQKGAQPTETVASLMKAFTKFQKQEQPGK
ncbi:MAG: 30S ribosomal protein S16 [Elusimicrobiota bacterium]|jgi:small subunit ribosomal protein S16